MLLQVLFAVPAGVLCAHSGARTAAPNPVRESLAFALGLEWAESDRN
jgi:hypothetical protein